MIRITTTDARDRRNVPRWLLGIAAIYAAVAASAVTAVVAATSAHNTLAHAATTNWLWMCAVTAAAVTAGGVVAIGAGAVARHPADP